MERASIGQREVAKRAGVARSAVSMYINNYGVLSEDSERRIAKAIEELGYRPSRIARSLKGNKSLLIGVVYFGHPAGTIHDFVLLDLLQGVQKAAFEEGYALNFIFRNDMTNEETLSDVLGKNVEGIVFIEDNFKLDEVKGIDLPKVVINRRVKGLPSVWADLGRGIGMATEHLISLGHERIAYVGGPLSEKTCVERWNGFRKSMAGAGLEIDGGIACHDAIDNKDSYVAMLKSLSRGDRFTAVVCDNDIKAFGAVDAIHDFGLEIPKDISVTGFDNIAMSAKTSPPLTTISYPRLEIGYAGGSLLLDMLNGRPVEGDVEIPLRLEVRDSCHRA